MPPAVAYAAMAAGAGLEAKAAYDESKSEQAISAYNAAVSRQEARTAAEAGAHKAAMLRDRMRRDLARNEALVATGGAQMAGSPFQAQLALISGYAADISVEEYNSQIEARRKTSQARAFEMQKEAAKKAGKLGVAQALVGGVSDILAFKLKRKLIE